MQYTADGLFVGSLESANNCGPAGQDQEIWPKFMLMVMLQGEQRFVIDGEAFALDAGCGRSARPQVFMLNVAHRCTLRFLADSETPLRKVMISAPQPWIKRLFATQVGSQSSGLRDFFSRHLARFSFEPGQHTLQLAEKIMAPPGVLTGELSSLYLRAQANEILWQSCLTMLTAESAECSGSQAMSRRQFERVRDFIIGNIGADLTIDRIAREAGASASTVQRNFKEHFGLTIFDFIRHERLEAARRALANDGIPVSHAAHLAGYSTMSAFTTAFRKAYGLTPKQVRA